MSLYTFLTALVSFALIAFFCWLEFRRAGGRLPVRDEHDDDDWVWPARRMGPEARSRIEDRRRDDS